MLSAILGMLWGSYLLGPVLWVPYCWGVLGLVGLVTEFGGVGFVGVGVLFRVIMGVSGLVSGW